MSAVITLPDSIMLRVGKEAYEPLAAGTLLHRIHPSAYGPVSFNDTPHGNARFSPIRDAVGAIIPTIYAGQSFECATCEIILRCPDSPTAASGPGAATLEIVAPADFALHQHSVIQTTMDLTLVNVTIAGQRKIGINSNALLAGPRSTYPATRAWAERIHQSCPTAQGLYYTSSQWGPQFAVVLFEDRLSAATLLEISTRSVADPDCDEEIRQLASSLSIEYFDI